MDAPPLRHGPWRLADLADVPCHGRTVLSTFAGGGGSSMGYKLAGFDVVGAVELDQGMADIYRRNLHPRHLWVEGVADFTAREDLPPEVLDLDVLDGSPPCSSFSMAGKRQERWGRAHHFREGQASQVLDDLFFQFIDVAERLRPRVVVAENVLGMARGKARWYVGQVLARLRAAGYEPQLFRVCASRMGVPQRRERLIFLARRTDLGLSAARLAFDEPEIPIGAVCDDLPPPDDQAWLAGGTKLLAWWRRVAPGGQVSDVHPKGTLWNWRRVHRNQPAPTIPAHQGRVIFHWSEPRRLSHHEVARASTFPDDYDYHPLNATYACGMSVPPFMMQRIATEVYRQWLA